MLAGDDVLDLKWNNDRAGLWQQAVLAMRTSAPANRLTKGVHRRFLLLARRRRALD
jgi:hypothetical protein